MNLLAGKKDTFWHNKSLILLITGVADVISSYQIVSE